MSSVLRNILGFTVNEYIPKGDQYVLDIFTFLCRRGGCFQLTNFQRDKEKERAKEREIERVRERERVYSPNSALVDCLDQMYTGKLFRSYMSYCHFRGVVGSVLFLYSIFDGKSY